MMGFQIILRNRGREVANGGFEVDFPASDYLIHIDCLIYIDCLICI